jgi:hypothetical protein
MTIRPLSPPTAANPTAFYWHKRYEAEREARHKLEAALREKDQAMGVLFDRLRIANVDCSDLFS